MHAVFNFGLVAVVVPSLFVEPTPSQPKHQPETVLIHGMTVTIGNPDSNTRDYKYHVGEAPLELAVKGFRIGKHPVTAEQLCEFLNSASAKEHDRATLYNAGNIGWYAYSTITLTAAGEFEPRKNAAQAPANQVSWKGAALYCKWLGEQTGRTCRLPSEAEWEVAARGRDRRHWPWGSATPTPKHGERYDPEKISSRDRELVIRSDQPTWTTVPVGSHPGNTTPEGVQDMLGYFIGEWCANTYVTAPTAGQFANAAVDLTDFDSDRSVRGCFHRRWSRSLLGRSGFHPGFPWTRSYAHPINAIKREARYGFRVAEEIPEPGKK